LGKINRSKSSTLGWASVRECHLSGSVSGDVTILICLGAEPDTWWQAKNVIGREVLRLAAESAATDEAREALVSR
jgi:hypothetical protein